MGVKVQVISSKFYKQWINAADFSADLTNYTNNLAGSVMQKIKLVQQVSVSWESNWVAQVSGANTFWVVSIPTSTTMSIVRNDGGNFLRDGMSNGDVVDIVFGNGSVVQYFNDGTITFVDENNIFLSFGSSVSSYDITNNNGVIKGKTPLTSLIYNYGLVENGANFSGLSLVNGEEQAWYTVDTVGAAGMSGRDTTMIDMEGIGVSNAWENGSCKVGFVSDADYKQTFEIEHEFIIPFFDFGDTDDLENNVLPTYLDGLKSLKYVFDADFRTVISNPNTSKKAKITNILGSVGWFDENFNGFDSNYQLNSVTYTDVSLNSADGVLLTGTTTVTVEIEKLVGNFGTDNVGVYFSYLPQLEGEVKNTATNFEDNFMYDVIFAVIGSAATSGTGVLDNCLAAATTNILTITFETTLSTAQQLRLANGGKYVLGFEVGDSTIAAGNSDAVILKTINSFDFSADIPDLMTCNFEIFPHTQPFLDGGFSNAKAWNEDGFGFKGRLFLDLAKDARIDGMKGLLVAYNATANSYFILDEYNYQLGILVVNVGGQDYQILDMSSTRNYPLVSGSEKNGVSVTLDQSTVVTPYTSVEYDFTFAQKIRWEDWIRNYAANPLFYDSTKENSNLNYKSSNFTIFGYKIRFLFEFNVYGTNDLGVSANTIYRTFSNKITVYDYEKDAYTPTPRFTQTIETFTSDGSVNLSGAIQVGVDTLMKITWTSIFGSITSLTGYWAIHRIEKSGQTGQQIDEFSSYEDNELTNNLLKGITNDYLDLALVGGKIVSTCLIDGTKILDGVDYNLSGRIESPSHTKVSGVPRWDIRVDVDGEYRADVDGNIRVLLN